MRKFSHFFFSKKFLFISFLFSLSVFVNLIFVFQPLKGKNWLSKIYKKPLQTTLQKVDGPLIANEIDVRVLKVKLGNKIYLDFLSKQADDSYSVINSVELKGNREAYYIWGKKAKLSETISLMLLDDDGDGALDVIAPTFDKFFRPHINLVVYNPKTSQFELKDSSDYPKIIPRF